MNPEEQTVSSTPGRRKFGIVWFWIFLLLPPLLSLTVMILNANGIRGNFVADAFSLPMLGASILSGAVCGIWCARRMTEVKGKRVLVGISLATLIFAVQLIICVAGCSSNISFH